ncbi:bacteriohemerythrin [Magnetococcus sp. PR-3]|uniref:bacteriohemerythrin n=1 Tax=Magnetococcus sp. PR-3 TaxID=3120355 RepID=UPI002FCE3062
MENIIKLPVASGLFWVEIAKADVRILCGCPMDSVKHLIKRGLILSKERDGSTYETGPNAILLSDIMLQNGELANLGEFPVLQMLYRQGLILPGHPNNTGVKPLLIGSAEQVNAQLQYIYRGNYGLVSKEEIMKTGIDAQTADEMMRLKLRFAFGAIRPSSDLLESRIVTGEPIEIRNGVTIERLKTNHFCIRYADEQVEVNLNLQPGQAYESAYPLGFQKIQREYFGVIHSGEGDGWDVNRPSMSSILMFQGKIYLIDAGPNIHYNLTALGIGVDEVEGVFQTHAHDDHMAGITTLMRAGHRIKFYATPLIRASVEKKISALLTMEEERFGEFFEVCDLEFDQWNNIEGLEAQPIFSPHPVETNIFIFRTMAPEGYKTYAHFADIVALDVLEGMVTDDDQAPGISRAYFDTVKAAYLTEVNLKKIDIGGGMIHGVAKDFKEDQSDKILLSHTAFELSDEEKEIGSNSPHGFTDTLMSSVTDPARRSAFNYIQRYYPDAPIYQLRLMINSPMVEINPGTIMLKEGDTPQTILLVINGVVDKIRTQNQFYSQISSGSMVGDIPGLFGLPSDYTYRTSSFVRAIELPAPLYTEFVKRNNYYPKIEKAWENHAFLETTHLLGEGIPYTTLFHIIDALEIRESAAGTLIACDDPSNLYLLKTGSAQRRVGGQLLDHLQAGDYFGEETSIFDVPSLYQIQIEEPTTLVVIPAKLLKNIPIVRWKLFESYQKRIQKVLHNGNLHDVLCWNDTFSVRIMKMDTHHKKLIEIANSVMEAIRTGSEPAMLNQTLQALSDYTHFHFAEEEGLMAQYAYPDLKNHQARHKLLLEQLADFSKRIAHEGISVKEFQHFMKLWLIQHIHQEDRLYATYLNEKGIY